MPCEVDGVRVTSGNMKKLWKDVVGGGSHAITFCRQVCSFMFIIVFALLARTIAAIADHQ